MCPPKNRSPRTIPLSKYIEPSLRRWQKVQAEKLSARGIDQTETTPVCASDVGTYMHPCNLGSWWDDTREQFGMEGFKLHELRHSFLTLAAHSHPDLKALMDIGGHKSIKAAQIYLHGDMDAETDMIDAVDGRLDGFLNPRGPSGGGSSGGCKVIPMPKRKKHGKVLS